MENTIVEIPLQELTQEEFSNFRQYVESKAQSGYFQRLPFLYVAQNTYHLL